MTGNCPHVTPNGTSCIDLTLTSVDVTQKILNWNVMEEETLSVHKYISFELLTSGCRRGLTGTDRTKPKLDLVKCRELLEGWLAGHEDTVPFVREITALLKAAKVGASVRERDGTQRVPYWWNQAIETAWRNCNIARREAMRARRLPTQERQGFLELHKEARKVLKREIRRSKRAH